MPGTGLAADRRVLGHDLGDSHPESPRRFLAVMDRLTQSGLTELLTPLPTRTASHEELMLVHTPEYVALVERETAAGKAQLSTGDTDVCNDSLIAARAAAGAVLSAVDAVFAGTVQNAFCNVRPPGHHASQNRGMGFCLFNNIALATRYAQRRHGAGRVLIADWDVHHGNGTQDIFYDDPSVLFFSTHQSPWYPGTGSANQRGEGAGLGTTINCPFPAGSGRAEILGAFESKLLPVAKAFHPDLILLSAGFDSRAGDPLGQFTLQDEDFRALTDRMLELAESSCEKRLISVLEGGYSIPGLVSATESHIRALANIE